jgi:hypothetical protein
MLYLLPDPFIDFLVFLDLSFSLLVFVWPLPIVKSYYYGGFSEVHIIIGINPQCLNVILIKRSIQFRTPFP